MTSEKGVQEVLTALSRLADERARAGAFLDAALVLAGGLAIRGLWNELHPPPAPEAAKVEEPPG
jgi:hypothetical protein